jgi:hypothetical protein
MFVADPSRLGNSSFRRAPGFAHGTGQRVIDPDPQGVCEASQSKEALPALRQWIHQFPRYLPVDLDDEAQH